MKKFEACYIKAFGDNRVEEAMYFEADNVLAASLCVLGMFINADLETIAREKISVKIGDDFVDDGGIRMPDTFEIEGEWCDNIILGGGWIYFDLRVEEFNPATAYVRIEDTIPYLKLKRMTSLEALEYFSNYLERFETEFFKVDEDCHKIIDYMLFEAKQNVFVISDN